MLKLRSHKVQARTGHGGPLKILVLVGSLLSSPGTAFAQHPLLYTSLKAYIMDLKASIRQNAGRGSNAFGAPSTDQVDAFRLAMHHLLRGNVSNTISRLDPLNYDLNTLNDKS